MVLLDNYFKSRLSLIVRVNVVLNRTVVVDSDWRFDNLCGSHLQSQSELYHISWWCSIILLVIDLIGQLRNYNSKRQIRHESAKNIFQCKPTLTS